MPIQTVLVLKPNIVPPPPSPIVRLLEELKAYQQWKTEEGRLRDELGEAEGLSAQLGPGSGQMVDEIEQAMLDCREKLTGIRQMLLSLRDKLEQEKQTQLDQKIEAASNSLEEIMGQIKEQRQEYLVYEEKAQALEKQRAVVMNVDMIALAERIIDIQRRLADVENCLETIKQTIKNQWSFDLITDLGEVMPETAGVETLDDAGLGKLVMMVVGDDAIEIRDGMGSSYISMNSFASRKSFERQAAEEQKKKSMIEQYTKRYDNAVMDALAELRNAIYPACEVKSWMIFQRGNSGRPVVSVYVEYDETFEHWCFKCMRYDKNGRKVQEVRSESLRPDFLIRSLVALHGREKDKQAWQVWVRDLPAKWKQGH